MSTFRIEPGRLVPAWIFEDDRKIGSAASMEDAERIVAALASAGEVERLHGVLRMLTISHRRVDGDPFYSCEIAKKQDADDPNDYPDARCDCGADHHNERIRKALFARPQEATAQGTGDSDGTH